MAGFIHTTTGPVASLLGCVVALVLFGSRPAGASESPARDDYVQATVTLLDSVLRPGATGTLAVTFVPAEDIYIMAEPPVEVSIISSEVFRLAGSPLQWVDKHTGYLSLRGPVIQKFLLVNRARPGLHRMKGRLLYYYCSDSEGWCRKQVAPFECVLRIVR